MVWVVSLCIVLTSCLVLFCFRSLVLASSTTVPPSISSSFSSTHVFASLRVAAHWCFTLVCRCLDSWGWISLQFESPSSHVLAASCRLWCFSRSISTLARSNWPWSATTCLLFSWSVAALTPCQKEDRTHSQKEAPAPRQVADQPSNRMAARTCQRTGQTYTAIQCHPCLQKTERTQKTRK